VHRRAEDTISVSYVLIIEDDLHTRTTLVDTLGDAGYAVRAVPDGAHALPLLRESTPSLIVTDLFMPRVNGGDLLALLERDRRWSRIPVVVITGHAKSVMAQILARSGMPVLAKPFSVTRLLEEVRSQVVDPAGRLAHHAHGGGARHEAPEEERGHAVERARNHRR
jgi:CheY-like chemotaxis protein